MIGYRKLIVIIIAFLAEVLVLYNGVVIPEELQNQLATVIISLIEMLVIPGAAGGYLIANVQAKKVLANGGSNVSLQTSGYTPTSAITCTTTANPNAVAEMLGAPIDIDAMVEQATENRDKFFNYKFASTKETGLYYAFRDLGNATGTTSLQHVQQFWDKLIELSQSSWLAEVNKIIEQKEKPFAWSDKDLPENLQKGYPPGCHALNSYSWARKFSLSGLYRDLQADETAALWLEELAQLQYIDIVKKLGPNCTLYRVGVNARELVENNKPSPRK